MNACHRLTRRILIAGGAAVMATGVSSILVRAQDLATTPSMRGDSNNYRPSAPNADRIGGAGFWMTGTVLRAGDGSPLADQRIQIGHTTDGHERDPIYIYMAAGLAGGDCVGPAVFW